MLGETCPVVQYITSYLTWQLSPGGWGGWGSGALPQEWLRTTSTRFRKEAEDIIQAYCQKLPWSLQGQIFCPLICFMKFSCTWLFYYTVFSSWQRAVYCLLSRCDPHEDHADIAATTDDYLWLKLCVVSKGLHNHHLLLLLWYSHNVIDNIQNTWIKLL